MFLNSCHTLLEIGQMETQYLPTTGIFAEERAKQNKKLDDIKMKIVQLRDRMVWDYNAGISEVGVSVAQI